MDPIVLLTVLLVLSSVVLTTIGLRSISTAQSDRITARLGNGVSAGNVPRTASVTVHQTSRGLFTSFDQPLMKLGWGQRMQTNLKRAEIDLHVSEFVMLRILFSIGTAAIIFLLGETLVLRIVAGVAGFVVWIIAGRWVAGRISHRQRRLENQLDSALLGLATSLKSGFGFLQACQLTLDQLEWPLKNEFEEMLEDISLGASIDDALRSMADRVQSYEMHLMVNAILVQRSVGGDVGGTLENIARTLRERRELNGHIMALTAQQRLSAYFVSGLPILVGAFLSLTSWEFMRPLFLTQTGNILIAFGAIFDILGFLTIRRLTRIDF